LTASDGVVIDSRSETRSLQAIPEEDRDGERLQRLLELQSQVVAQARKNELAERECAALRQEFGQSSRRASALRRWVVRWLDRNRA
jgi:hypothetical protein